MKYMGPTPILLIMAWFAAYAQADIRAVQSEFGRCASVMERVERSLRRYEGELTALKRGVSHAPSGRIDDFLQELSTLENRQEYFRNRYERAQGQADKIRDDLKNVSGPTCPSCVESSVNLYCRNGETLQADIDDYLDKAADMRARIGLKDEKPATDGAAGFARKRTAADSLYRALTDSKDACFGNAAAALLEQTRINLAKADSLHAVADKAGANKALDIARTLLDKAAARCGAEQ